MDAQRSVSWPTQADFSAQPNVRVVIISDTHGAVDPRIAALLPHANLAIHAGDIGSHAVLSALETAGAAVAVTGNNDVHEQWDVPSIPPECAVALPGGTLVVEHGHRRNPARDRHDKLRRRHAQARMVVYGHSHKLLVDEESSPIILNPGASGHVRTHGGPSCAILDASEHRWEITLKQFPRHPVR